MEKFVEIYSHVMVLKECKLKNAPSSIRVSKYEIKKDAKFLRKSLSIILRERKAIYLECFSTALV